MNRYRWRHYYFFIQILHVHILLFNILFIFSLTFPYFICWFFHSAFRLYFPLSSATSYQSGCSTMLWLRTNAQSHVISYENLFYSFLFAASAIVHSHVIWFKWLFIACRRNRWKFEVWCSLSIFYYHLTSLSRRRKHSNPQYSQK